MSKTAPTTKNILVVAGDPSGDLHAAKLIQELKKHDPELNVTAMVKTAAARGHIRKYLRETGQEHG